MTMKCQSVLAGLAIALLVGCAGEHDGDYVGYVEAEYVFVAPPQSGWLTSLHVREGDLVTEGALLFDLDTTQQQAQLDAASARMAEADAMADDIATGARPEEIQELEAQLAEARVRLAAAKSEFDRWMPLVREGNASQSRGDEVTANYEAARARVMAAEEAIKIANLGGREARRSAAGAAADAAAAALAEARWRLDERTVHAGVAGAVEAVYHREGEYVGAAAPVLAIPPEGALKVRFFAPQADVTKFSVGDTVQIRADGADTSVDAVISFIASEAEFTPPVIYSAASRDKLVFLVEARPANSEGLKPGLPVDVIVP